MRCHTRLYRLEAVTYQSPKPGYCYASVAILGLNLETRFLVCESESNMAEGGNVPELGGYDYEFTSKVPDYWECLVCQLTLKYPVQIEECGHRLCKICIESLLR